MKKLLCLIFGVTFLVIGFWLFASNRNIHTLWPIIATLPAFVGSILINRGITGRPLFNQKLLRKLFSGEPTHTAGEKLCGIASVALMLSSIGIIFLGRDNYFGYNRTHDFLVGIGSLGVAVIGAFLLWRYLSVFKKFQ